MNFGPEEIHSIIANWTCSDEQRRKAAETAIQQLLNPANGQIDRFMMTLAQLLSHPKETSVEVRKLICILIRKKFAMECNDHSKKPIFTHLKQNTRMQTIKVLLKQCREDPDKNIRNQITDCLTELSTSTLDCLTDEWRSVQFIQSICSLYTDSKGDEALVVANQINALQLLGHLCGHCSDNPLVMKNQQNISQIYQIAFSKNPNRRVKIASIEALQLTMTPLDDKDALGFRGLMGGILSLLENTLQQEFSSNNDADADCQQTQFILEILCSIAQVKPILFDDETLFTSYCNALLQCATNAKLPDKVRTLSLEFLLTLCEADGSICRKKQIMAKTVITICMDHFMVSQMDDEDWNDLEYGVDEDHDSLSSTGEYALDRLIRALSSQHVLPLIYTKLGLNEENTADEAYWKSNDWRKRHCAVTMITQTSEFMEQKSKEVIIACNKCLELFNDKSHRVQYAAINAVGQMSNDHFDLLPVSFNDVIFRNICFILNDGNNHIKLQAHACAALINFTMYCQQEHVASHLDSAINSVMRILQNSNNLWNQSNDNNTPQLLRRNYQHTQEQALTAIAALATSSASLFREYYDKFAPILMSIVKNATSDDMQEIRCRAIECMGRFAEAVGFDKFEKHSKELMLGTIDFFQSNPDMPMDDQFVHTNIQLWPRIRSSIGNEEFAKYLNATVAILHRIASIDVVANANKENVDMLELPNESEPIAIDSSKLENKVAAIQVICQFVLEFKHSFFEYLDKLFDCVLQGINDKYSFEVQNVSIESSICFIQCMIDCIEARVSSSANVKMLALMSDKLLNMFMSVLDKGRNNTGENSESQSILAVCKALVDLMHKIDPTDNDGYDPQNSVVRTFIDLDKLEFIFVCLFDCIDRSQYRIEQYSQIINSTKHDAIAKEEWEEEKEYEDDLLFNIALIIAEFIKIFRDDFLKMAAKNNNLEKLLTFLNANKKENNKTNNALRSPEFVHKTGVYILCDIYEQCSVEHTSKLLDKFIPSLFEILGTDSDLAVQQAAFYCLGLMVSKCKNATVIYAENMLKFCMKCIADNSNNYKNSEINVFNETQIDLKNDGSLQKRQFLGVLDNAMSAICKITKDIDWNKVNPNQMGTLTKLRDEALHMWVCHLPVKSDCIEGIICHEYLFQLLKLKNPIVLGKNLSNMPYIIKIFAKVIGSSLSSDLLNGACQDFVKVMVQQQPQFASQLTQAERRKFNL